MKQIRPRLTQEEYDSILEKRKPRTTLPPNFQEKAKILLIDIETLPMEVWVWGLYKQRIPHTNIKRDWCIVCWSAKWLYDSKIHGDLLTGKEAIDRDDSRIMKSMWALLDEADIVIAHNGIRFDVRKLNARFLINKIPPPSPFVVIDTLKESQKALALSSHRMDFIGFIITGEHKMDTEFSLWIRCNYGDHDSLLYMFAYCKKDVILLEDAYLEIRPWIKGHPNIAIIGKSPVSCCTYCGSIKLKENSQYITMAGRFNTYRCEDCGGYSRERFSDISIEDKRRLLVPVAK